MNSSVFWDVTQPTFLTAWSLKTGPIRSTETSVRNQPTLRNIPEDGRVEVNRSGSLRSRKENTSILPKHQLKFFLSVFACITYQNFQTRNWKYLRNWHCGSNIRTLGSTDSKAQRHTRSWTTAVPCPFPQTSLPALMFVVLMVVLALLSAEMW